MNTDPTSKYIILSIALLFAVATTCTTTVLYTRVQKENTFLQKQILDRGKEVDRLTDQLAQQPSLGSINHLGSTGDPFIAIPSDTQDLLLAKFPFTKDQYTDVRELSSRLVVALMGTDHPSVWKFDLTTGEMTRVQEGKEQGLLQLEEWSKGVVIRTSDGGEGSTFFRRSMTYVDGLGSVLADTVFGNYERDERTMTAHIASNAFELALVQKGDCSSLINPSQNVERTRPTTTLLGLTVNKKYIPLPTILTVRCKLVYSDSIPTSDVAFPEPGFDGKNIVFNLPGYVVSLTPTGTLVFEPEITYQVEFEWLGGDLNLLRNDQDGVHIVKRDVLSDSLLKQVDLQEKRLVFKKATQEVVTFSIHDFVTSDSRKTVMGTVDYNLKTESFENLLILPHAREGN